MEISKQILRQRILAERMALTPEEVREKSSLIAAKFLKLSQYSDAKTLLIYLPFRNEVDTAALIEKSRQHSKRILVPVCRPNHKLLLSELHSLTEVAPSSYGIPEPSSEFIREVSPETVDVAVLPGVAFDKTGYRLGYGGGYFDRFVHLLRPDCLKVALIYAFQLVETLPAEAHDLRADMLLTERDE